MYRMLGSRRPWLIAGIATALLLTVGSGVALAASPYRVHVKAVPKTITHGTYFQFKFKGFSHHKSVLVIALNQYDSCAATLPADVGARVFKKRVKGHYSGSFWHYAKFVGQHHACAYLTNTSNLTRAHSGSLYTVE